MCQKFLRHSAHSLPRIPIMATDSAPVPAAPSRRRHYWQLPVFVLGVAAAVAAYVAFPPPPRDPADQFARDLTRLRTALDRRPVDLGTVKELVPVAVEGAERFPAAASQARFLAGSGHLAMAEAEPATAAHWTEAARLLAATNPASLPEKDRKLAAFRRAKADAATGAGDPKALASMLNAIPPGEEVEGERRRLVAEAHRRESPPNWRQYRDEMKAYLSGPTRMPEAGLAECRLQLAEALVTLNEPNDARTWLNEVGEGASEGVRSRAAVLLGRMAAAEGSWAEAAKRFDAALATPGLPADRRGRLALDAGQSHLKLKDTAAARQRFEAALTETGEVATAAAVRLAELGLRDAAGKGNRAKAVDLLRRSVADVPPGAAFRNPHVTATELRAAFEEAVQVLVNENNFAAAVRLIDDYAKVAEPGRGRERRADVNAKWAALLQKTPATATEAAAKFKSAADDYAALAATHPTASGQADLFRRAASCLRLAGDEKAVIAIADRIAATPGIAPDIVAAAWIDKGEALLADHQFPEAIATLQKALTGPAAAATQARVKLALAHLEQGKARGREQTKAAQEEAKGLFDLGQKLLAQAANATPETAAEKDAQQQAVYELGKILLDQGNVPDAEARFRQMVQTHPTGPLVGQGRLYLGSCLLLLARGDHRERPPADRERKLAEAKQLFESLTDSPDRYLQMHADIRLVNAMLLLKQYDDLPPLCDKLAARYAGKVEELIVLSMLYSSYRLTDRVEPAARTFDRMEAVYAKLTDADFVGGEPEYTREYWQTEWIDRLRKQKK